MTEPRDPSLMVEFLEHSDTDELNCPHTYILCRMSRCGTESKESCEVLATDEMKRSFPAEWAAFQAGRKMPEPEGLPISEIVKSKPLEHKLAADGVTTVEQVAELSDGVVSNLPGGYKLREDAKKRVRKAAPAKEGTF